MTNALVGCGCRLLRSVRSSLVRFVLHSILVLVGERVYLKMKGVYLGYSNV